MKRLLLALALAFATATPAFAQPQQTQRQERYETAIEIVGEKVIVPVTVNGRELHAVYDSGASNTYLSRQAAEQLGLALTHGASTGGFGGRADVSHAENVTLGVAGATMRFSQMRVVDLSALSARSGRRYDMILGTDAMRGYVLHIDPLAPAMRWTARAAFRVPESARAIPIRRWSGHLHTPVSVNGHTAEAVIDIGNSTALIASRDFARDAGVDLDNTAGNYATGIGGGVQSRIGNAAEASVGGMNFSDLPISIYPRTLPGDVELNVGFPIWRRFHFYIDFERNQVWLAPITQTESTPFPRNLAGLIAAREAPGALRILFVSDRGPAHEAGLAADDVITAIDGVAIADWPAETPISQWQLGPEGAERRITLQDGRTLPLRLARYY
jgi:predicted aspartyl protease